MNMDTISDVHPVVVEQRRAMAAVVVATKPKARQVAARQRCTCGGCDRCLDDAKWERIFREKFVDANYYAPRLPRAASSLDF